MKKLISYVFLIIFPVFLHTIDNKSFDKGKDDFCRFWDEYVMSECNSYKSRLLGPLAGIFSNKQNKLNCFCRLLRALNEDNMLKDELMELKSEPSDLTSWNNDFENYRNLNSDGCNKVQDDVFKFIPPRAAECLSIKESELTDKLIEDTKKGNFDRERLKKCIYLAIETMKCAYENHKKKT